MAISLSDLVKSKARANLAILDFSTKPKAGARHQAGPHPPMDGSSLPTAPALSLETGPAVDVKTRPSLTRYDCQSVCCARVPVVHPRPSSRVLVVLFVQGPE